MGKKVSIFAEVAFMLIINAVLGPVLTSQCANHGEECFPHHKNPCCCEEFKCRWLDSVSRYQCIEKAKLGDYCSSNDDCSDVMHSTCSRERKCACRPNNIQVNDTSCKPLLHEFCWNESCAPDNSICVEKECKCKSGFMAESNDQCLPILLGSPCDNDATCKSIKFAKCSADKICICSENTVVTSSTFCSLLLGEYCRYDHECRIANSECSENKCRCKPQYSSYSNTECKLSYLGMFCESSFDCKDDIRDLVCIDNACKCSAQYSSTHNDVCLPTNYRRCWRDSECQTVNSVCIANSCQCKPNYLSWGVKCLPRYLEGLCHTDSDCFNIDFTICFNGKCNCDHGYFPVNRTACVKGLNRICVADEDCFVRNSHCFQNRCECISGYIQSSWKKCLSTELQGFCFDQDDCSLIPNARCSKKNRCICKENHIEKNYVCAALLNESCSSDGQCAATFSVCIDNKCQCNDNYLQQSINKCVNKYHEKPCETHADCKIISNARCSNLSTCVCYSNYGRTGAFTCAPLLGGYCEQSAECVTENSRCFQNQCLCSEGYMQHSNDICVAVSLGEKCLNDKDCDGILNGQCSEDNICVCKPNYSEFDRLICLPLIGEYCEEHKECSVYNSNCLNNKCQCLENYMPLSNAECLSKYLDTICFSDADCQYIINSQCSRFNRCVCKPNYIAHGGTKCASVLGGYCRENYSCETPNSECIDQKCQCKPNFARGTYNNCLPTHLEEYCKEDCSCVKIRHSKCSGNKCICRNNHVAINNTTCGSLLNGFCDTNNDCIVEDSFCIENKCQCGSLYMMMAPYKCEPISLGKPCETDIHCSLIQKAICSPNKICICDSNSLAVDTMTCAPLLNTFCRYGECKIESSHCIQRKCQCKPGYSAASANQCVKTSSLYSCLDASDCVEPWHFECSEDKKCVCRTNNFAVNNSTCLPILNGYCWKNDQCITENSICIDFSCQCMPGFVPVSNNKCMPGH